MSPVLESAGQLGSPRVARWRPSSRRRIVTFPGGDAAWPAGAQVRYALSRKVELEGATRALVGDHVYAVGADFAGDPRVHIFTRHALLFGIGLLTNFRIGLTHRAGRRRPSAVRAFRAPRPCP